MIMIDIKLIRENPELVKENIRNKFQNEKIILVDKVRELDNKWRKLKYKEDNLRAERNKISQMINIGKKAGKRKEVRELMNKAKEIPKKINNIRIKRGDMEEDIKEIMFKIPNIIHESVPLGKDSSQNLEIKKIGKIGKFDFPIKSHVELGEALGMLDFDTSAKVSGTGFYYLKGDLALLNMALINFARDYMVKQGFEYVEPPLMIKREILNGVYSNEEIEQMTYKIHDENFFLIATSEHPLIGQFINKLINGKDLPIKQTGYSMCFRKEIGSHGIDEKGLFRTHQFNKQEMIVICLPAESYKWYDKMLEMSVGIYKELNIPIRVLEICSGDLADLKAKSCDIEFWSPRQGKYSEIGSLTNMEEAQARRLNIKVNKNGMKFFAHTLNNTVIATSRALVAIMENNQQKDGSIKIPHVLRRYMNRKKFIGK